MPLHENSLLSRIRRFGRLNSLVAALWAIALLVIFIRAGVRPQKNTVITTYQKGAQKWIDGKKLYKGKRGFVYSPVTAAFFVPFTVLPNIPANILWRLINAGILLGAVAWWLKLGIYRGIPKHLWWLVFLLLLPLSIGNFNNGQVNPLIIGLLMIAVAGCHRQRWFLAAFCVAVATYFKIYPLAIGLLLAVVYPKQFTWRLFVAVAAIGALSFVLQKPAYVLKQYELWFETRLADNRFLYGDDIAPRDLWMLLRLFQVPITQNAYMVLQVLSGGAIALLLWAGRRRDWTEDRLLAALFSLGCGWMLLCGPATESATYIMLAPAVALAAVQAYSLPLPAPLRVWVVTVLAILLVGLGINSFLRLGKNVYTMSVQPFAALLFCGFSLGAIRRPYPALKRPGSPSLATPH